MAYRFEPDEQVGDAVRRVAHEQLGAALESLDAAVEGDVEAVHDVRKRCKKLRGLLRIVRPALADAYRRENGVLRDAAHRLSPVRDEQVMVDTLDDLVDDEHSTLPPDVVEPARARLRERQDAATRALADDPTPAKEARSALEAVDERADDWPVHAAGFAVLAPGMAKVYRRGRRRMADARRCPGAASFHQWRKRAKYLWYHTRLLSPLAPVLLGTTADRLHELSDALGDEHDLNVLYDRLDQAPGEHGGAERVRRVLRDVLLRREALRERAFEIGARLYVEKPKRFVDRVGGYWEVWQAA